MAGGGPGPDAFGPTGFGSDPPLVAATGGAGSWGAEGVVQKGICVSRGVRSEFGVRRGLWALA